MKEAVLALAASAVALGILQQFCDCFGPLEKLLRGAIGLCALALVMFPFASAVLQADFSLPDIEAAGAEQHASAANARVLRITKESLSKELTAAIAARFGMEAADMEITLSYGEDQTGAVTVESAEVMLCKREHAILSRKIESYVQDTLLCRCSCRVLGGSV